MAGLNLCTPALVYLVLAIISIFTSIWNKGLMSGIGMLVFALLWTWFLNYLCSKGHSGISWFLVALPFIFVIIAFLVALEAASHLVKNPATANAVSNMQVSSSSQQKQPMMMQQPQYSMM